MRNLQDIHFQEKSGIVSHVQSQLEDNKNNAYDLSKLILMAALLGDNNLYTKTYNAMTPKMLSAHENLPSWVNEGNKAGVMVWLFGRMSYAGHLMEMSAHLHSTHNTGLRISQHTMPKQSEFSAWGTAYRAIGLPSEQYKAQVSQMLTEATTVTSNKEASRAEMLWVWVMIAYAAAHQNDTETYNKAWDNMKDIHDVLTPNDSKAWALAMLYGSAQMMKDSTRMGELITPLRESIADPAVTKADKVLAQLTFQLAKERDRLSETQDATLRNAYQYVRGFFSGISNAFNVTRPKNTNVK